MSALGDLYLRISGDIKPLKDALGQASDATKAWANKADQSVNKVSKGFKGLKAAIGGALVVGALAKGFNMAMDALDRMDKLGDVADKIGFSAEKLQELHYAAKQTGVTVETMNMSLQRFTRRVGEAVKGKGELKDTLAQLGISLKDVNGNVRNIEDVFQDYVEAIKNAKNPQEQLRLAFKGFDSEGAALVNTFRDGAEGLAAFAAEARALGIIIDEELIRNAGEAKDRVETLKSTFDAKWSAMVADNADAISWLADNLIYLADKAADAARGWKYLLASFDQEELVNRTDDELKKKISEYRQQIMDLKGSQSRLVGGEDNKYWDFLQKKIDALYADANKLQDELIARQKAGVGPNAEAHGAKPDDKPVRTPLAPPEESEEDKKNRLQAEKEAEALEKRRAAIRAIYRDENEKLEFEHLQNLEKIRTDFADKEGEREALLAAEEKRYADEKKKLADEVVEEEKKKMKELADARLAILDSIDPKSAWMIRAEEELKMYEELGIAEELLAAKRAENQREFLEQFGTPLQQMLGEWEGITKEMEDATRSWTEGSVEALTDAVMTGKANFKDFANSIIRDLIRMIIKQMLFNAIANIIPGGAALAPAMSAGASLGRGNAGGGAVFPGKIYPVGEKGPELFAPSSPGRIINNGQTKSMMGGPEAVKVEVVNRGTPQKATDTNVQFDAKNMIVTVVMEDLQRGGKLAQGLNSMYGMRRKVT